MTLENKRLGAFLAGASMLLLAPLIAMQYTDEVRWSGFDFLLAAVLLFGTAAACELVLRKVRKTSHRLLVCGLILLVLALVWAELAVGVFGTPFAGS